MDVRALFAKPKLAVYIPSGQYQPIKSWDFQTNRDYVVQGELLRFYLIVSFSKMLDSASAKKASTNDSSKPAFGSPSVPAISGMSSPGLVSMSSPESYTNTPAPVMMQQLRDLFRRLKLSVRFQRPSNDPSQASIPAAATSKTVGYKDFSVLPRPRHLERELRPGSLGTALSIASPRISEPSPVAPVSYQSEEMDANVLETSCIVLENGDFAFPLQVMVALDDAFLNEKLTLVVAVQPAEKQMSLDDLLSGGISFMEKSPPIRFIGKQVFMLDPLSIKFETKKVNQRYLITTTMENTHSDPISVSSIQLHLTSVQGSKSQFSELSKFFRAEVMLPPNALPLIIRPMERFQFIVATDAFPVSPLETIDLAALKPALLITWVNSTATCWMQSQFLVPFPDPIQSGSLLLSFELDPSSIIHVNQRFNLIVTISNLKDYPRNLSIDTPLPEHFTNISEGYSRSKLSASSANGQQRSSDGVLPATAEHVLASMRDHVVDSASVFFLERHQHIGVVAPRSEISVSIPCVALAEGLFRFKGIRVIEQNPVISSSPIIFSPETDFEVFVS